MNLHGILTCKSQGRGAVLFATLLVVLAILFIADLWWPGILILAGALSIVGGARRGIFLQGLALGIWPLGFGLAFLSGLDMTLYTTGLTGSYYEGANGYGPQLKRFMDMLGQGGMVFLVIATISALSLLLSASDRLHKRKRGDEKQKREGEFTQVGDDGELTMDLDELLQDSERQQR